MMPDLLSFLQIFILLLLIFANIVKLYLVSADNKITFPVINVAIYGIKINYEIVMII
jgi:hypothetical protein